MACTYTQSTVKYGSNLKLKRLSKETGSKGQFFTGACGKTEEPVLSHDSAGSTAICGAIISP